MLATCEAKERGNHWFGKRTYRRRCVVRPSETLPRWHQWRQPRYGRLLPYIETRSRSHSHHRRLQDSLDVGLVIFFKLGEVGLVIFFKKKGSDLHVDTPCRPHSPAGAAERPPDIAHEPHRRPPRKQPTISQTMNIISTYPCRTESRKEDGNEKNLHHIWVDEAGHEAG